MGAFSYEWSRLPAETIVGRYCSIASHVIVMGPDHYTGNFSTSAVTYNPSFIISVEAKKDAPNNSFRLTKYPQKLPVILENDVWIGNGVWLKPGIIIHTGAVVGAGAVVVQDVGPYEIVGGVPAKLIRRRFSDEVIADMMTLQWWRYKYTDFNDIQADMPIKEFVEVLAGKILSGEIQEYYPGCLTGSEVISTLIH